MKKQEILDIAKELILITVKYRKNIQESQKQKLLGVFEEYEKKLKNETTKYAQTILSFVVDLKNDLISGKELNIDKISTDEYLQNYLLTKNELMIYNSLILEESYRKIFDELNKEKKDTKIIEKNFEKLIKNFVNNLKKLNTKIIAQNLLLFTSFERKIAKKYLINLYNHLIDINHKKRIFSLIEQYNLWIIKIKEYWINFYNKWNFNYKYIWYRNINWKSVLDEKIIDCSKIWERTWFTKLEYKKLLKQL